MGILDKKTIVITGGSMGIGLAVAKECATEGARVIIISRHEKDLSIALEAIKKAGASDHRYYEADVSDAKNVAVLSETVNRAIGPVHGLVNCAGVYGPIGKLTEIDMKKFSEAVQINLLGTVFMCHSFAPLIKKSGGGKIVNFSGGGAASPFPHYSAYAVSKIGIVRLTENLSVELAADHISVNSVAPGFVITRLHQETVNAGAAAASEEFLKKTLTEIEKGGVPPERAVTLTAFLLSEKSDGITGKFISAPWDSWDTPEFQALLKTDKDFATLRRIDDKSFFKKIP